MKTMHQLDVTTDEKAAEWNAEGGRDAIFARHREWAVKQAADKSLTVSADLPHDVSVLFLRTEMKAAGSFLHECSAAQADTVRVRTCWWAE